MQPSNSSPTLHNPCVRNCCLDDDETCLGCGRQLQDILRWHQLSDSDRALILQRANSRQTRR